MQNEFNSDIARFTTHESNLSFNKSACCRLRKVVAEKVGSSSTFCNKICTCGALYRPMANLFCNKWRNSHEKHDSCVIFSNQKSVFTQLATTWFVWTWVVKRATFLFNSFCSNVAKQVASFCCPFYHSVMLATLSVIKTKLNKLFFQQKTENHLRKSWGSRWAGELNFSY